MKINNRKGFTLIELMVVIAIIGILATSGISMYSSYQAKARDTKRTTSLNTVTVGLQGYFTDKGVFPESQNTNCLATAYADASNKGGEVVEELKGYYDNKSVPMDPQNTRLTGNCSNNGSFLYKAIGRQSVAKTGYILATNVEAKTNANMLFSEKQNYEDYNLLVGNITDAQRKTDSQNVRNVVYAILN